MTVQALDTMQKGDGDVRGGEAEGAWDGPVENDLSGAQVGVGSKKRNKKRNKKKQSRGGEAEEVAVEEVAVEAVEVEAVEVAVEALAVGAVEVAKEALAVGAVEVAVEALAVTEEALAVEAVEAVAEEALDVTEEALAVAAEEEPAVMVVVEEEKEEKEEKAPIPLQRRTCVVVPSPTPSPTPSPSEVQQQQTQQTQQKRSSTILGVDAASTPISSSMDSRKAWCLDTSAVSKSEGGVDKEIPYEELKNLRAEDGIEMTRREAYLSAEEFVKVFDQTREQFNQLAGWRQLALKKKVGLF